MRRKLATNTLTGRGDGSLFSVLSSKFCLSLAVCVHQIVEARNRKVDFMRVLKFSKRRG
jgi:hypothetical protein